MGSFSQDPVYNPNKFGVKLGTSTYQECLDKLGLPSDIDEISENIILTKIHDLFVINNESNFIFADAQNLNTPQNLTPLEIELCELINRQGFSSPFSFERLSAVTIIDNQALDPNEPNISPLEKLLREKKKEN